MNHELIIPIGNLPRKVFLQDGFYQRSNTASTIHMHNYPEIHIITGGSMTFSVGDFRQTIESGSAFMIPPHCFHGCLAKEETTRHTAFQIELPCEEFSLYEVSADVLAPFFRLIDRAAEGEDYSELVSYLSFLAAPLCRTEAIHPRPISDHGFLIHEFFAHRYGEDLRLSDLAVELHLSERQTERLVLEHTGHTFREELTRIRLKMADRLLKSTDLSLTEIAQYVGYRSYAGFWKAMKNRSDS